MRMSFNVLPLSLFIAYLQPPYFGSGAAAQSPGDVQLKIFMDGWKYVCAHPYTIRLVVRH